MTIFYEDEVKECLNEVVDCKEKEYALYLLEWAVNKRSFDLETHDKEVRAKAIDDFVNELLYGQHKLGVEILAFSHDAKLKELISMAKQLKEQS